MAQAEFVGLLPTPPERSRVAFADVFSSGECSNDSEKSRIDPSSSGNDVLERRLHKAITANAKWQQKYEIETQANQELGRRVRSWKAAYTREVHSREDLEEELASTRQASEAQAETYRQEIRRLAALVLRVPSASIVAAASPTSTSSSRAGVEENTPPASPGSARRSTPPGRGKRPPGRSLTTPRDGAGPSTPQPHYVHRAAGGCGSTNPTRSGWSKTPSEESLNAGEGWSPVLDQDQERETADETDDETADETAEDMASTEVEISSTAARLHGHLPGMDEEGSELTSPPGPGYSSAASCRIKNKRAPGWGPSASAGRYSETNGVSRLRLALQGGNSSVFPRGASSARLGFVREPPTAGEWLDGGEGSAGFKAVELFPTTASTSHGERAAEQDEASPVAAVAASRKASGSAGDPLHAGGDGACPTTTDADGSNLEDGASITPDIGEPTSAYGAPATQSRLPASLTDNRHSAATWFEASCHAPSRGAGVADEAPALLPAEHGDENPGRLETGSVSPSSGPTRSVGEGVAYKYRRRSECARQSTPTAFSRSSSFSSSDASTGPHHAGGEVHRRSSSSPLPPLSPRLRPSKSRGDDGGGNGAGDDAATSCRSQRSSSPSEAGSCEELLLGPTGSSSPRAPAALATAPARGVTAAVVVVRKANTGGTVSGSGKGGRTGTAAARSRGRSAQSRLCRDHGGGRGGGRGGHGEICAILGGTVADAWEERARETSASGEIPVVDTSDEEAGSDEHQRAQRDNELESREQAERNVGLDGGGGSALDCGLVGSVVGGPLSDRSTISDISDDEGFGGQGNGNGRNCSAELPPSNADSSARSEGLVLQGCSRTESPPKNLSRPLPGAGGGANPTAADCSTSSTASNATLVEGGEHGENSTLSGQSPPAQPKPRIIELYHSSPASSTSTSLSSSSTISGGSGKGSPGGGDCRPGSGAGSDGGEEESLEISLGSSNNAADTFAGMQVSLGSLYLSDTGSSESGHSFALERRIDAVPVSADSAEAKDGHSASLVQSLGDDGDGGGTRVAGASAAPADRADGEDRSAEQEEEETNGGKTGRARRHDVRDSQAPRLFESLLSIGVPADWDVKSMVYRTSSAGATGDVKTPASRRTWGRQASGGGGSSSSSSSSAGSWIRSVFSASSSSSDGGGGKKGRGGGAAGGGAGDETSGTVSASSDGIAATTTTGTLGGVTSTKSPLPERKLEVGEVLLGVVPACSDRHRRQNATVSAGEDCMGQDSALGRGTAPILHASAADRLAPQVLARYPPEATLPCENVADYCFPQGVRAKPIDARESQSSLNKVLFQPGSCQRGSQSFVFMFSGDHGFRGVGEAQNHRTYGVCVTYPKVLAAAAPIGGESSVRRDEPDGGNDDDSSSAGTPQNTAASVAEPPAVVPASEPRKDGPGGVPGNSPPRGVRRGVRRGRCPGEHNGSGDRRADVQVWGCYCLLTRLPFFDLHFQVLWDLLAAERIMRMKMTAERRGRVTVAEEAAEAALLSSRMEDLLEAVSRRYMNLAVPNPGEAVRFHVHPDLHEIRYQRGKTAEFKGGHQIITAGLHEGDIVSYDSFAVLRGDRIPPHVKDGREMVDAVAAWALPSTLSLIPADVLLAAVGALMCEYQVIVVSENLGLLSSVVLSLAALTRPLLWVHPLVPIMPMDMAEMLSAPVPYLIGTPRLEGRAAGHTHGPLSAGQILLDADEKKVVFAHADDASSTKLPRCRALLARLAPLAKVLGESCGGFKSETPLQLASGSQAAASEVVQATVAAHISAICAGALRHRQEIIETTSTGTYTPPSPTVRVACTSNHHGAPPPAEGGGWCADGRAGEARERSGGDFRADVDPTGLPQRQEGSESNDHLGENSQQTGGNEIASAGTPPPPLDTTPAATTAAAAAATVTPLGSAGEDDGDRNEEWWEEGDEDEEEPEEAGARPGAVGGLNKLWRGATAASTGAAKAGRESGAAAAGGSGRWMHRRVREAPFLRLLVGSQAFEVYRAAAADSERR